jgi:outer membrane protein assembly factor BamB
MLRRVTLLAALAACNTASGSAPSPGTTPPAKAPPRPQPQTPSTGVRLPDAPDDKESQLITQQLVAMNAHDKFGAPSRELRAGSVSKREAPAAKKTEHGFEIRFGNNSPVSTPTVYNGRVYSSGGFNSREFYAFDARSGRAAFGLALSDDGPSAGACADDVCVFNTESCTTFAIDAKTGKQKWSWFLGDPQTSSPSIANSRVFTSYPAGQAVGGKQPPDATHVLAAFDLHSGKVIWQDWLDADVISAPVAVGDFVYVATFNGTLIKLEQATGKIRYATRAHATSAPVVEFVAGLESMYYTPRADATGTASSSGHAAKAGPVAATRAPAPDAKEEIVRTDHNDPQERYHAQGKKADYLDGDVQDKSGLKQDASKHDSGNGFAGGAPAAAAPAKAKALVGQSNVATMQQFQGSRILHMSGLNVNTMGDELIATDPEDGKKLWSHALDGDMRKDGGALGTPPVAAGGHLLVATLHGKVLELDPKTGKTQATFEVGGTLRAQPVAVDGWIYVGTEDGRLVAIDTGDVTLTGWPMWGGDAARTGAAR